MKACLAVLTGIPPAAYEVWASSKAIARPFASSMMIRVCVSM